MKNRVIAWVLFGLSILFSFPLNVFAAGEGSFSLSEASASPGQEFSMDIYVENNPGLISLRFQVKYDTSVLELIRVEDRGLLKGYTAPSPDISSPYTLRWADSLATTNSTAKGKLVTLTFKALKAEKTTVQILHEESRNCSGNKITFLDYSADVSIKGSVSVKNEEIDIYGTNLTLGNTIDMNFFLKASSISGSGFTAKIICKSGTSQIPQRSWKKMGSYYCITFVGISPAHMTDEIEIQILNTKGEQVSANYSDSVQKYVRRMMNRTSDDPVQMKLYAALLTFGAAAQKAAGYDTGNFADSVISAAEKKQFAPEVRNLKNILQSDKVCSGTDILWEDGIIFRILYNGSGVPFGAYAVASYKDRGGTQKEVKTTRFSMDGNLKTASFSCLNVADCSTSVTVNLYDREGKLLSTVTDSVESIASRTKDPVHMALIALSDACCAYFGN